LPATTEANQVPAPAYSDGSRDDRTGSSDLQTRCNADAGWTPVETGNFASRLGAPVATGLLTVSSTSEPGDTPGIAAIDVFTMPAQSLCEDDVAVIALERRLDTPRVAIRFGESSVQDTGLILSGFCQNATYQLERREWPVSVQAVATTAPSSLAPARSILTSSTVAGYSAGGAAFAADSMALVGLVMSGTLFPDCEPSEEGSTLVMALAPYRRMLLDIAEATGETLYAEYQPEIGVEVCGAPPGSGDVASATKR
jgi:hypothetical protein